jgi:hypothetical protein
MDLNVNISLCTNATHSVTHAVVITVYRFFSHNVSQRKLHIMAPHLRFQHCRHMVFHHCSTITACTNLCKSYQTVYLIRTYLISYLNIFNSITIDFIWTWNLLHLFWSNGIKSHRSTCCGYEKVKQIPSNCINDLQHGRTLNLDSERVDVWTTAEDRTALGKMTRKVGRRKGGVGGTDVLEEGRAIPIYVDKMSV